tara:strand:+ start:256 stop:597 length:342 start_codon:yes stop_codon:yes gene_type:complete
VKFFKSTSNLNFHIFISITWLWGLALFNHQSRDPIMFIFPYLIPVMLIAWGHGSKWGFVLAALATLSAMPDAYVDSHTQTELVYAGIATYAKLTGAAIGISVAKKIHKNINPT